MGGQEKVLLALAALWLGFAVMACECGARLVRGAKFRHEAIE